MINKLNILLYFIFKLEIDSVFSVESSNPSIFHVPDSLMINQSGKFKLEKQRWFYSHFYFTKIDLYLFIDAKNDDNTVPLIIKFGSDKMGVQSSTIVLRSNVDDVRYIPIEVKILEKTTVESTSAYLEFSAAVFDTILQPIPIVRHQIIFSNFIPSILL
jgi:hypothetical protein